MLELYNFYLKVIKSGRKDNARYFQKLTCDSKILSKCKNVTMCKAKQDENTREECAMYLLQSLLFVKISLKC